MLEGKHRIQILVLHITVFINSGMMLRYRLRANTYATVTSFFPDDEEGFEALDPKILLQQIEERLVTTDQAEQKKLSFKLAKQ